MSPMSWCRNNVVRIEVAYRQANVLVTFRYVYLIAWLNISCQQNDQRFWFMEKWHGTVLGAYLRVGAYMLLSPVSICALGYGLEFALLTCEILRMVFKRSTSRLSRMHATWRLSRSKICPSEKKWRRWRSETEWNSILEALQFPIPRYWTLFLVCRTDDELTMAPGTSPC